jgi:hypothetical protein
MTVTLPRPYTPVQGAIAGNFATVGWLVKTRPSDPRYSSKAVPNAAPTRPLGPETVSRRWSGLNDAVSPAPSKYRTADVTLTPDGPKLAANCSALWK